MDGLRRLFAQNPDELIDVGTPSDEELEQLGQEIHAITNARATARAEAIEPVRPNTPEGATGGELPTVTLTEHSLSYTGMLPPLSDEGRQHGADYYYNLLSPEEWIVFHETRAGLLASRPLNQQNQFMLEALDWYLAAIQHGSIYDAGEIMRIPNLLMHRVITEYLFSNLLGRDGIRPSICTFIDLNKFNEPTTGQESDDARVMLRSRLSSNEWDIVLDRKRELSGKDLSSDLNARATFEALTYLTDICDVGSISKVAQRARLTPAQVVHQIDLLVLREILKKPVPIVNPEDVVSTRVTDKSYYTQMLTPEQHKLIIDKRLELETKTVSTPKELLLLNGIRCFQLSCRLGSFNLAQRECESQYDLGIARAINCVRYVLFEEFLGLDLTKATKSTSEPPTQPE